MEWMPCSGLEPVDGLVWIKRMAQKARRADRSLAAGEDLMNGYLFGRNDYLDGQVLRFLQVSDTDVLEAVRSQPDDVRAAQAVLAKSGRSAEECRRFSERFCASQWNFAFIEADEGRLAPGMRTSFLRFFYNRLVMPVVYRLFHAAERRRSTGSG